MTILSAGQDAGTGRAATYVGAGLERVPCNAAEKVADVRLGPAESGRLVACTRGPPPPPRYVLQPFSRSAIDRLRLGNGYDVV